MNKLQCTEGPFRITTATHPVLFSGNEMGRGVGITQGRTNHYEEEIFKIPAITKTYIDKYIHHHECCSENPYQMLMDFRFEKRYHSDGNSSPAVINEMSSYLEQVKEKTVAREEPLYPHILFEAAKFNEQKPICLLCSHNIPRTYFFECLTCHDDMLIFFEILHNPRQWIPLGWGQFISKPIAATPSFQADVEPPQQRFSIDYAVEEDDDATTSICHFLAKSLQHCRNTRHVSTLQLLCLRHICFYLSPPCPMENPTSFRKKLKKTRLPSKIVEIFEDVRDNIFEYSQFDMCAPINGAKKMNGNYSRATIF